jgi:hypothetical protein
MATDDIKYRQQMQNTITLLKILVISERQIERGEFLPVADAFKHLRERRKSSNE